MQLIKIDNTTIGNEVKETVSARELHSFLEVSSKFADWMKNQIERARLVENMDYVTVSKKIETGGATKEYFLTIEAGKSIGMMSATDKGFEIRDYFLECERRAKSPGIHELLNNPEAMHTALLSYSRQIIERDKLISDMQPKVEALNQLENADGMHNLTTAAKILNIPPQKFIADLSRRDWIYRMGVTGAWTGKQPKIDSGYLVHKIFRQELPDGGEKSRAQVLITPKGMAKLATVYAQANG